jgi:hypothetical protein
MTATGRNAANMGLRRNESNPFFETVFGFSVFGFSMIPMIIHRNQDSEPSDEITMEGMFFVVFA